MLAAIAGQTKTIHLGSAVTVLSTDDPVRVFERFSTLNAISNGRAEVDRRTRIVHRIVPAVRIRSHAVRPAVRGAARAVRRRCSTAQPVTWSGRTRPALRDQIGLSTDRIRRPAAHLGRRRRKPGLGRSRGPPWPATDAGDHRRQPAPVPAVRRSVHRAAAALRPRPACRWVPTRLDMSRPPTSGRARNCGRTTRR